MVESLPYEELIDHIVTNKPIPNIVQIPDITYDESQRTQSSLKVRPKPWETKQKIEESPLVEERSQDQSQAPSNVELPKELQDLRRSKSVESISHHCAMDAEVDAATNNDNR